ncbi:MAG: helix-turn-helix transcriptional regulator, partial [Treponema sp.]|nr:helix-turn-helix transcriptional regulator [Treponema sp.]
RGMEEKSGHNSRLKAMMLFIDERYKERITLSDIATAGGVSQSLCNQIFNKLTEKSPIEYLAQYRCRKVADLLVSSGMSMPEIADMTGFTGASYMAETFKKYFGQSPRDYKKGQGR